MAGESEAFDVKTNARSVLAALKEFEPKLATEVRRDLRKSGDAAIAAMGEHLFEDVGHADSKGRLRKAGSKGSREEVRSGLKMRVTTGQARTSVRVTTTKGALRKAMNLKSWRHPVFGGGEWAEQRGTSYFNRGGAEQRDATNEAIQAAMSKAVEAVASHVNNTTE